MSIKDQIDQSRKIELSKLKKDQLIERCIKQEHFFADLESKALSKVNEHKEEIRVFKELHEQVLRDNEEYYTNSNSYEYVKQILEEITKAHSETEWYRTELENLQQNGYQDLRAEIEKLRSKIVRMA